MIARGVQRHVVVDVEAILDTSIPPKYPDRSEPFWPPVAWEIVSLGCFSFADFEPEQFGILQGATECQKVERFADYLEKDRPCVVGWNTRGFDSPVIGHRAMKYGIPMPWWYGTPRGPRYRYGSDALDLKDALGDFGATQTGSMNQTAILIGFPGKGDVVGSDVATLYAAKDFAAIDRYCLSDVAQEAAIWLRYELLRGNIKPKDWARIATRFLSFIESNNATKSLAVAVDRSLFIGPEARQLTFA